jgi:hypothetical protein
MELQIPRPRKALLNRDLFIVILLFIYVAVHMEA